MGNERPQSAARVRALDVIGPGATMGVGALPHRVIFDAITFSFEAFDIPTVPSMPRRSPAEGKIAQALIGVKGVTAGQYGAIAVDAEGLDPAAPVLSDLASDGFGSFRACVDYLGSTDFTRPIKWQFVGPVSVGIALIRAGATPEVAFPVALQAVRSHLIALAAAMARAAPNAPQLIVIDEPFAADIVRRDFPIAPVEAIDLLSASLASVESVGSVGVHARRDADIALLLEAGPGLISLSASVDLGPLAGYIDRFLRRGGWVAWGVVATVGPVSESSHRAWNRITSVWCDLVQRGCDLQMLRNQAIFTPTSGLGSHSAAVAGQICGTVTEVARMARGESSSARLLLGA